MIRLPGAQIKYSPLGPRFEFDVVEGPRKPPSERFFLFNMMASLDTHEARWKLHARLIALKNTSVASKKGLPPLNSSFLQNTESWRSSLPGDAALGRGVSKTAYRNVLFDSVFTLCPSGALVDSLNPDRLINGRALCASLIRTQP